MSSRSVRPRMSGLGHRLRMRISSEGPDGSDFRLRVSRPDEMGLSVNWLEALDPPKIQVGRRTQERGKGKVPRGDWLAVLGALTGQQADLLEIRYDLVYGSGFKASLEEICPVREAVDQGDLSRAVLQARKGVSLMEESVRAATGEDLRAALTDRFDERHADLYGGILKRAKDMGHLTAYRP